MTEKLKGSLIAPVLMTSKCNGLPVPLLGQAPLSISKIDAAYQNYVENLAIGSPLHI